MQTFVALLRGINVGKGNRVPMAELRSLLIEQGYTGVATLLNSGNAVFRADKGSPLKHAAAISDALATRLDVKVPVIVKSAQELAAIVRGNPIDTGQANHSQLLVAFLQDAKALVLLKPLEPLAVAPELCVVGDHAAYLNCANGILESKAANALLGKAGKAATTRNWATVLKLQALVNASA